jgi:hypothetical protein
MVLWSLRMTPSHATSHTPFFMIYGAEAVLPADLDYGTPRVTMYKELEAKEFLEDALDQLDEARDVDLLHSAMYNQTLHRYHSHHVRGRAFNIEDLVFLPCLEQQGPPQAHCTVGGSLHHRGSTPTRRHS